MEKPGTVGARFADHQRPAVGKGASPASAWSLSRPSRQLVGACGDLSVGSSSFGCRVVVRSDVLGMPDVAVPALAVVLPDELPVRLHQVAPPRRDPRRRKALRAQHRSELGARRIEGRGLLGDRQNTSPRNLFDVHGKQAEANAIDADFDVDASAGAE